MTPSKKLPDIKHDDAPLGATEKGWHQIEAFLRCPKAYQYSKLRGIYSPKAATPDYFATGFLMHVAKAHWFLNNFRSDAVFEKSLIDAVAKAATENKLPVSLKAEQQTLVWFKEYMDFYGMRVKPKVLAAEYLLGPVPLKPDHPLYSFRTARLDDVSWYDEAGGALCIGETKTTSGSIDDCTRQYEMHGQLMLQYALWKVAPQGEAKHGPVAGVMLDVVQKGYGGKPCKFGRRLIAITPRMAEWFTKNLELSLKAAYSMDWNTDARRNVQGCTYMAGRARVACEFQALCKHGRSATTNYVMNDGQSLLTWKPSELQKKAPWD